MAAQQKLKVIISPAIQSDPKLLAGVKHATQYFQQKFEKLPEEVEVSDPVLNWCLLSEDPSAIIDDGSDSAAVVASFVERNTIPGQSSNEVTISSRQFPIADMREHWMRALILSVISERREIISLRRHRLLAEIALEEQGAIRD